MNTSAQTVYALRVLRTRGLSDDVLQHIYRATVVARLTYAASTWYGLTKASDRKRIHSVLDRVRRHGYCPIDLPAFDELYKTADDELFGRAMRLSHHFLHALIRPKSSASQRYNLVHRPHLLQLPSHTTRLSDSNFITRMLYRQILGTKTFELSICVLCIAGVRSVMPLINED